jgi:type 1 glutamine amidotransferase
MSKPHASVGRRAFLHGLGAAGLFPLLDTLALVDAGPLRAMAPPVAEAAGAGQGRGAARAKPLMANLVCGAPLYNHDFDFARQRLLSAVYEAGGIQARVAHDYDDGDTIEGGDLLISYTSQVPVDAARCAAIRRYLEKGGRWLALHASTSVRDNTILPGILGSRFLAHPPYGHFPVSIAKPADPLLAGIEPFEVDDELYVVEPHGEIDVLLHTRWGGTAMGRTFEEKMQPLMYRHRVGAGGVLYLALGHCAREFDRTTQPGPDQATMRGPWDMPVYKELIRRGIEWAAKRREPA